MHADVARMYVCVRMCVNFRFFISRESKSEIPWLIAQNENNLFSLDGVFD